MSLDVIFGTLASVVLSVLSAGWLQSALRPTITSNLAQIYRLELAVLVAHNPEFFANYSPEVNASLKGEVPAINVLEEIDHDLYDRTLGSVGPLRAKTKEDRNYVDQAVERQWNSLCNIKDLEYYRWQFRARLNLFHRWFSHYYFVEAHVRELLLKGDTLGDDPLPEITHLQRFHAYVTDGRKFTPPPAYSQYRNDENALETMYSRTSV